MFPNKKSIQQLKWQQGFLLPLALFILVVMGVLALTIARTSIQTQTASVAEVLNLQSFYAAESGAQRAMQHLFFDSAAVITRANVNTRCSDWSQNYAFTSMPGLQACSAQVNCIFTVDTDDLRSFYTITSVGSCGTGQYRAERTIQAGAFMERNEP